MRIAALAKAPVILVGDIDRGGVFASIVGTMELLPEDHRNMVKGFVINKFRGDISLLEPGLDFLEKRFSIPVLGVIPYIRNIRVAQEDSVYLDERISENRSGRPDVCIIRFPHISNYDDFDPLETSCNVRYVSTAQELGNPDLIILPGTKSTMDDLGFLRKTGMADAIIQNVRAGVPAIGICGGYQMLGNNIYDLCRTESDADKVEGLGLLDFDTSFEVEKVTSQVSGHVIANAGLFNNMHGTAVKGYEIHMGRSESQMHIPVFEIAESTRDSCMYVDGSTNQSGTVFGTYMHGLFNNAGFTGKLLDNLCSVRGIAAVNHASLDKEKAYNDLASTFRENLNMKKIYQILSGGIHG
jgi:adenosylcobyric acid synthase